MTQSTRPLHLALIPDGNGRWARTRGLPRQQGHLAGLAAVRRIVACAPELGIGTLTFFAFSTANWARPAVEVDGIFSVLRDYLRSDVPAWKERGVRVRVMGRRDRLPAPLRAAITLAESETSGGRRLLLRLAADFSGRESLVRAACRFYTSLEISPGAFGQQLAVAQHGGLEAPEVDLLIRTGGEQRLSDFLLWECAYAELYFSPKWWPDFNESDLAEALEEYVSRTRTFGRISQAV
jgi:undecaprenyl diphosphate synthase